MENLPVWLFVLIIVLVLIVGIVLGFLVAKKYMVKYLKDNPPITEEVVRAMMAQMGRTPSEKQVRQVMKTVNGQYDTGKPKTKK